MQKIEWDIKPPFAVTVLNLSKIDVPVITCKGREVAEIAREYYNAGGKEKAEKIVSILNKHWGDE